MAEPVVNEQVEKVSDKLKCSICSNRYKDPKILSCFHVFCTPCLVDLVVQDDDNDSIATCPTCQNITKLPEGGVAALHTDFHTDHLFQVCEALEKSCQSNCEKCKKNPAVGYCRECKNFICNNCSEMHKMWGELAKHEIVLVDQVTADTTLLVSPKQTPKCSVHTNKKLKIYCNTCAELICTTCSMSHHKTHSYELVHDTFDKHKEDIISSLKPIEEKLETIKKEIVEFDAREMAIKEQKATIESDLNKEIQDLHEKLDLRKEELLQTLESRTESKLRELSTHKQSIETLQLQIATCLEYATKGIENGSESELLSIEGPLLQRMSEVTAKFNEATLQPQTKADTKLTLDRKEQFMQKIEVKVRRKESRKTSKGRYLSGDSADNRSTKLALVAKKINPKTLSATNALETIDSFVIEKLHYSNSIQLYALSNKHTIAEFKEYGTLNDYIQSNRRGFTVGQVMKLASQIAETMSCVEEHGYIHRDLALRNIVLGQNHLCILGELTQVGENGIFEASSKDKFAIKWTAPEAMFHNKFTIKSDVWSFGILLYELVTFGRFPYPGMSNTQVVQSLKEGYRMSKPVFCPPNIYTIMQSCWQEEPSTRPTFETLQWQLEELFDTDDYVTMLPTKTSDSSLSTTQSQTDLV